MRWRYAVSGLLLVFVPEAWASHPLLTDDAGTQGPAGFEAEFNGAIAHTNPAGGAAATQGVSLHLGLTQTLDLGVTAGYEAALNGKGDSGMGDPSLDLKWRIADQENFRPALGLRADYKAPQHSPVSSGTHDGALATALSWDFDHRFLYTNAVLLAAGLGPTPALSWTGSIAYGEQLGRGWYGVFDVVHESSADMREHSTAMLVGAQWKRRDGMLFSAGAGPALDSGARAAGWMATVAVTLSYAPKETREQVASVE